MGRLFLLVNNLVVIRAARYCATTASMNRPVSATITIAELELPAFASSTIIAGSMTACFRSPACATVPLDMVMANAAAARCFMVSPDKVRGQFGKLHLGNQGNWWMPNAILASLFLN